MNKLKVILLALCAIALTGCGRHKINKGVVVDNCRTLPHVTFNSVNGVLIPIMHPSLYKLTVEDNGIVETFLVSGDVYASLTVGDSIRFEE